MEQVLLLAIVVWITVTFLDILVFWLFLRKIKYADKSLVFNFRGDFLHYLVSASYEEIIYRAYLLLFFYVQTACPS